MSWLSLTCESSELVFKERWFSAFNGFYLVWDCHVRSFSLGVGFRPSNVFLDPVSIYITLCVWLCMALLLILSSPALTLHSTLNCFISFCHIAAVKAAIWQKLITIEFQSEEENLVEPCALSVSHVHFQDSFMFISIFWWYYNQYFLIIRVPII